MADKLLNRMAAILAWIDDNRDAPDYYWEMCWGGLSKTKTWKYYYPNQDLTPPNNWPPTNSAPSNDSLWGLRYAFTMARIDSILRHVWNEKVDTSKAKGRHRKAGDCYGSDLEF